MAGEELAEGDAGEDEEHGEVFEGVAGLGSFNGSEQGGAQKEVGSEGLPVGRAIAEGVEAQDKKDEIEGGVGVAEACLGVVVGVLPPAEIDGEVFDARAEEHVAEAAEGQEEVDEDGVVVSAGVGQLLEAGIEGWGELRIAIVVVEELGGLLMLAL